MTKPTKLVCDQCHEPPPAGEKLLRCGRCLDAAYCSRQCQKTAWKLGHKRTCVISDIVATSERVSLQVLGLPDELAVAIFRLIDARSLLAAAGTAVAWRRIALDVSLWRRLHTALPPPGGGDSGGDGAVAGRVVSSPVVGGPSAAAAAAASAAAMPAGVPDPALAYDWFRRRVAPRSCRDGVYLASTLVPAVSTMNLEPLCVTTSHGEVLVGLADGRIDQRSAWTGERMATHRAHACGVSAIDMAASIIVTASYPEFEDELNDRHTLKVFRRDTFESLGTLWHDPDQRSVTMYDVAAARDGSAVIGVAADVGMRLFDVETLTDCTLTSSRAFRDSAGADTVHVAWLHRSRHVVALACFDQLTLVDVRDPSSGGGGLGLLGGGDTRLLGVARDNEVVVAVSPDDCYVYGGYDGGVCVADVRKPNRALASRALPTGVCATQLAAGDGCVVCAVQFWEDESDSESESDAPNASSAPARYGECGLAAIGGDTLKELWTLPDAHDGEPITGLAFDAHAARLVSIGGDRTVRVMDFGVTPREAAAGAVLL